MYESQQNIDISLPSLTIYAVTSKLAFEKKNKSGQYLKVDSKQSIYG